MITSWFSPFVLVAILAAFAPSAGALAPPMLPPATPMPISTDFVEPPSPTPAPSLTPMASPTATPTRSPSPTPIASPSPTATPIYRYRFVPQPPSSPDPTAPQIYAVYLNSAQLHDTIAIRVVTNAVVTKVYSKSGGQSGQLTPSGPGEFTAASKLPKIPFIARGISVNLDIVAYSADGRSTTVRVPVKVG